MRAIVARPTKPKIPDPSVAERARRRALAVRDAHIEAERSVAAGLVEVEKRTGAPHPLARLNCELARVVAASPASLEGEPPPTFAEVAHLLRLAATALRRFSEGQVATEAATLVNLCLRALSAPRQAEAADGLHRAAERAFDGLRVGLQLTPIGDRIESDLGHGGNMARAGRELIRVVERCLELPLMAAEPSARYLPPLVPGIEEHVALLAREIACSLEASPPPGPQIVGWLRLDLELTPSERQARLSKIEFGHRPQVDVLALARW